MSDLVLTVPQVAEALKVSRAHVYDRIRRHEIPVVRSGRAVRVPRRWLDEQLDPPEHWHGATHYVPGAGFAVMPMPAGGGGE